MENETIFFTSVEISEDEYNRLREFAKKQGRVTAQGGTDAFLVSEPSSCVNVTCLSYAGMFKLTVSIGNL